MVSPLRLKGYGGQAGVSVQVSAFWPSLATGGWPLAVGLLPLTCGC
jgi:hypothetical protein